MRPVYRYITPWETVRTAAYARFAWELESFGYRSHTVFQAKTELW